jgi:hypothetical protein
MAEEKDTSTEDDKEIPYDLRQTWAKVVGEHIINIDQCKMGKVPANYYLALEYLFDRIHFKFSDRDEAIKRIDEQRRVILGLANKYQQAWIGLSTEPRACSEVRAALRKLDQMLFIEMEEANMFGIKFDDEGL